MPKRPPIPGLAEARKLQKANPNMERDEALRAVGAGPTGIEPMWASHGIAQGSVSYRQSATKKRLDAQQQK